MTKRLVVLSVLLSGCGLYWGNNNSDDDDDCAIAKEPAQPYERDPYTGACEQVGDNNPCGPCEPCAGGEGAPEQWASCYGACDNLDETSCLASGGCHAEYQDDGDQFIACWDTLSNYQSTGDCTQFAADVCAEHDNCASLMTAATGSMEFEACIAKPNVCGTTMCASGSHCAEVCPPCDSSGCICAPTCIPDTTCADMTCDPGSTCETNCDALVGNCTPTCVPMNQDPGSCTGTVTCNSAPPACPSNTTAGIANGCYTGYCIPSADCTPQDPGLCYAAAACQIAPPACPSGSIAGVSGACWSGYCIPVADCEVPACESLTTEAACTMRGDCFPSYTGSDCTCDSAMSCTCQTLTFSQCMTGGGL